MKLCTECKRLRKIEDFPFTYHKLKDGSRSNRRQPYCKPCLYKRQGEWSAKKFSGLKKKVVELYGNKCAHCEKQYPLPAYDFHHVDPTKREYGWFQMARLPWSKALLELEKCILLCANCHRVHHWKHKV